MADWLIKASDGYKQIGDVLFYHSHAPATLQAGQTAVEVSHAGVKDFVSAYNLSLFNPILLAGLFIGAMMCFVFVAMAMKAVGRNAGRMVDEVRRQFREIPGIMEGTGKPEYAKCVAIATKGAQKEMVVPALMAIIVPVVTGIVFGVPGVVGLLMGGMTTGFTLASMLNNAVVHGIMLKNILKEEIMAARKVNAIRQVLLVIQLVILLKILVVLQ